MGTKVYAPFSKDGKEEVRLWVELIQWMRRIGYSHDLFQGCAGEYIKEMKEMEQKTEFFLSERKVLSDRIRFVGLSKQTFLEASDNGEIMGGSKKC